MSDIDTSTWAEAAGSNNAATPNGFPEGQAPSTLNDCARELMGAVKREWNRSHPTIASGGSSTVLTLTYTTAPAAYVQGFAFKFKVTTTIGASPTINVNGLGAKNIYKNVAGVATLLAASDWYAGDVVETTYDTSLNAAAGGFWWTNATPGNALAAGAVAFRSYLAGLTLSNSGGDPTNDIDIAAGIARDSTNVDSLVLASSLTKQLDAAWAVGTNAGGLDTGSIANAVYAVWLIKRPDTGVVDALYSTSYTAPTMPTNYTLKRRIGWVIRVSAALRTFIQDGDDFWMKTPSLDVSVTNLSTSSVSYTLATPLAQMPVYLNVYAFDAAASGHVYVRNASATDSAPSNSAAPLASTYNPAAASAGAITQMRVLQDASAQIAARSAAASTTFRVAVLGWKDTRGRDS